MSGSASFQRVEKSIVSSASFRSVTLQKSHAASFLLHRLYGFGNGIHSYLTQVHIRINFMEDWSPNRHFPISVGQRSSLISLDDFLHPPEWERPAISLRDSRQVRRPVLQRN